MMRLISSCCVALILLIAGCQSHPDQTAPVETYIDGPNSVPFDLTPLSNKGAATVWLATYSAEGPTARFRIELEPPEKPKQPEEYIVGFGTGRIVAEPQSESSVLLNRLKNALEAKTLPRRVKKQASVTFEYVNFGEHLSQAQRGGFNTSPAGNWTAMKIFLGEGEQEGEVFLNINPVTRKGQFSIKDPEYGDDVIRELAKVL